MRFLALILMIFCCKAQAVTFKDAIIAAHKKNPAWLGSQVEYKIAEESHKQAEMMFLPSIGALGSISVSRRNQDRFDNKTQTASAGVSVTQNLFSGFSTVNTVKAGSNSAKAAFHKLKSEEQNLIIKVLEAYVGIWAGRQKVAALRKKEENLKKVLEAQKISLEAGVVTKSEVALASANYQKAVYERINAETELFTAESEFEKLTGLKADQELELPDFKHMKVPKKLDALMAQAMTSNHLILYYKFSEQSAINELSAMQGRLSPSCDMELRAGRNIDVGHMITDSFSVLSEKAWRTNYSASVTVNVPIFTNSHSSGNTYSAIEIADQKALRAKFSAQDAILEIKKECIVNWNVYISAGAMIKFSRFAVKSAEVSSSSNVEESTLGLKSNTDVLVKENQLLESKVDLANSRRQKIVAKAKLMALTGNLSLYFVTKKK
jgi:TolC family type I secretion outer membrane protein